MRVQIILNPRANRGRAAPLKEQLERWGRGYGDIDVRLTTVPGDARRLGAEALQQGYDVVAAAGGDGTINELVNGLLDAGPIAKDQGPALGLIPIGSGNDYAHGLGIYAPPLAALERLFRGQRRQLDVAQITDDREQSRFVCNGIGMGLDAAVAIDSLRIKRIHGFPAYVVAALRTILWHYHKPHLHLRFDEERVSQKSLLLAVGVGPQVGGGFRLTPDASFTDGLLDSCLVDPVGRAIMLRMMTRVMKGTHITSSFVTMRRNQTIHVTSDQPLPIHIDGEIFARMEDNVREVAISTVAAALPLMI